MCNGASIHRTAREIINLGTGLGNKPFLLPGFHRLKSGCALSKADQRLATFNADIVPLDWSGEPDDIVRGGEYSPHSAD